MMEKVIFLGTGAGMPTLSRNVASMAVIFQTSGDFWLFDCGEGTQQQIQRAGLKLTRLKNIFITHLHGDHLFGLPGLMASRGLQGIKRAINIFGPVGLEGYLKNSFEYSATYIPYHYKIYSLAREEYLTKKLLWKEEECSVFCVVLNHQIDSFGYAIDEKHIQCNIMAEKLIKMGIMPGPVYGEIKEKNQVMYNGRLFQKKDFIKESVSIKKLCYCGDTAYTENAIRLSKNADLLIHEATFSNDEKDEAEQSYHSTIDDAIKVARAAGVKRLVLTHISPRYGHSSRNSEKESAFRRERVQKYPQVILAEDFLEIKI